MLLYPCLPPFNTAPPTQEVKVRRKVGQSLGMMVAVSKVEDDKSVIISTVDPNGLVAKCGLFKGLTLFKVGSLKPARIWLHQPRDFETWRRAR